MSKRKRPALAAILVCCLWLLAVFNLPVAAQNRPGGSARFHLVEATVSEMLEALDSGS